MLYEFMFFSHEYVTCMELNVYYLFELYYLRQKILNMFGYVFYSFQCISFFMFDTLVFVAMDIN